MAHQFILDFYNTAIGSLDGIPISVSTTITSWTELSDLEPDRIRIVDGIVYYEGYRFYKDRGLTNLVTTSTGFPSTTQTYYYYQMPQVNDNKFHFMLNGESKTIDLKTNFGSYFDQGDNTNCDYIGVLDAAIDSGYRAGNKTIYAGQRHPYPVGTKLTSCYYAQYNNDLQYGQNRLIMTKFVRFNEPITSDILNTIDTIEFEIETTKIGSGNSEGKCIKATIPKDNFRLLYPEGTTDIGGTVEAGDMIYRYTDYTNGSAGGTIDFVETTVYNNYTTSRGTNAYGNFTENSRGAKLKITVNYIDGTRRSSYVIDGNDYYTIQPFYSNSNAWLYYGDQNELTWEGNTNSTYSTNLISEWYPMENKT